MAKKRTAKKRQGLHKPSFVAGLLIGVAGSVLVFLGPTLLSEQLGAIPTAVPGSEDLEVVFEFPELLRRSEVPVNPKTYGDGDGARRIPPAGSTPTPAPAPTTTPGRPAAAQPPTAAPLEAAPVAITRFYVQAASYRDRSEAERLRAQLLLQGLPANTAEVALKDGAWHRVTIGPIESEAEADSILARLRQQNLSAIRINQR